MKMARPSGEVLNMPWTGDGLSVGGSRMVDVATAVCESTGDDGGSSGVHHAGGGGV